MVTDVDELGLAGLDPKATVVVATGNAHKLDEMRAISVLDRKSVV